MNVLGADDVLKKLLRAREVPSDRPAVAAKLCEPGFYLFTFAPEAPQAPVGVRNGLISLLQLIVGGFARRLALREALLHVGELLFDARLLILCALLLLGRGGRRQAQPQRRGRALRRRQEGVTEKGRGAWESGVNGTAEIAEKARAAMRPPLL